MNPKGIFELLKKTFEKWNEHKAPRLGAALAYYTIFSISPLLLVIIAIAGLVFGQKAAQHQILGQLQGIIPGSAAQLLQTMLGNTYHPGTNIVATIIGIVTLLLGAIGLFGALQDALDTIWDVAPRAGTGILGIIQDRLLLFALLLTTGLLLLAALLLSTALQAVAALFGNLLPVSLPLLEVLNFVLPFLVVTLLFALIFKFLPYVEIAWRAVWVGAAMTALLFTIGNLLIGLYLGRASIASTYGAASALVILLLWIYYSAQIFLLGAEFTRVYADEYGLGVHPTPHALGAAYPEHVHPKSAPTQPKHLPQPSTSGLRALPAPQANSTALAKRQTSDLILQRNLFALFGFIAGAILEARIISRDGRQDGRHR
jgi:membrane protein